MLLTRLMAKRPDLARETVGMALADTSVPMANLNDSL
jgi:hypothetical protein